MVAVGMTGQAALRHMADTVPAQAPDAVALALPADPEADAALRARLSALPGVTRVETAPFLHARISRLNGTPITERDVPRSIAWAVRGDRGLSWRAAPRPGTELTAGHWWAEDHDGPLLAAVDAKVAGRLSLALGDTLTLATPAGPLTATVAVLRRMDWTALELDFPIILSPPATPPPHSRVAALWMEAGTAPAVERAVTDTSPHSAVLPLAPILESLGQTVRQVRDLMAGVSIIALAAALVVLAAAILASARARRRDMAILKAIGVSPRQITRALTLEFMLLGFGVAALAVPLGTAAGVAVTLAVTGSGAAVDGVFPVIAFLTTPALLAAAGAALARRGHRFSAATELRLATAE
jgi:putative ABC transport system permease protein